MIIDYRWIEELERLEKDLKSVNNQLISLKAQKESLERSVKDWKKKIQNERRGSLAHVCINHHDPETFERIWEKEFQTLKEFGKLPYKKMSYMDYGVEAYFPEDDFGVRFSMDFSLLPKVVQKGQMQIKTGDYSTPVLVSPTYFEAFQYFHQSIYKTGDKHHIFLEAVRWQGKNKEGVDIYHFITGS